MVLSTLRAGSSCVAGALHRIGVDMGGGYFQPADKNNQAGYHEDLRWSAITKRITGGRYYHDSFQPDKIPADADWLYGFLARQAQAERAIWGIKNPRMALTAHWIWPHLQDCRIVVVHRPREQSIASLIRHNAVGYKHLPPLTEDAAGAIIDLHLGAVDRRLAEFPGLVLHVAYNAMVKHTVASLIRLEGFCFAGKRHLVPESDVFESTVAWIDPALNHHREIE